MGYAELAAWIKNKMQEINITQVELSRRSGLSTAQVSRILSVESTPSQDAMLSIARALRIPAEEIFRIAGLLPPGSEQDRITREAEYLMSLLTPQTREEALGYMRYLLQKQEEQEAKHATKPTKRSLGPLEPDTP